MVEYLGVYAISSAFARFVLSSAFPCDDKGFIVDGGDGGTLLLGHVMGIDQ